ncbi:MAG TPA: hypothetical protein VGM27_26295 [Acidobacteriaceae bacterium]|jgi:hypothetical protein
MKKNNPKAQREGTEKFAVRGNSDVIDQIATFLFANTLAVS